MRLLNEGQESFLNEANEVLRAGLESAAWITVDDTGARHKAKNGFCTQIGNGHFTWFGTTASKSRANFLGLLRAGHGDYVVNDEAVAYMRQRNLSAHVIARLTEHRDRHFPDQGLWDVSWPKGNLIDDHDAIDASRQYSVTIRNQICSPATAKSVPE